MGKISIIKIKIVLFVLLISHHDSDCVDIVSAVLVTFPR